MEVTDVNDKITHAVIGRGKTESFGLSEEVEFFHILSNALYSRKKEAVIREVMCNAWDAHVEAKRTDQAIKITLDNDKLIIRDFGEGIDKENIKIIYGTYGKSTKQHDGRVTGGFGLGSKVPFAYVDHFEVTSNHNGEKTIYKMSQSNAEVGGKPSITHILSIPTDETGVQVSINLLTSFDKREFEELIRYIAAMGGMKVMLNDELLKVFPFQKATDGFMLIRSNTFNDISPNHIRDTKKIFVRYGHVIYPIEEVEELETLYKKIHQFLRIISGSKSEYYSYRYEVKWVLILQAPPHSIAVTPSRESLSMNSKTTATLVSLMEDFLKKNATGGRFESLCTDMFREALNMSFIVKPLHSIFSEHRIVPLAEKIPESEHNAVFALPDVARTYLKFTYPTFDKFSVKELLMKIDSMLLNKRGNKEDLLSFKKLLLADSSPQEWFQKHFIKRIVRKADPKENIDIERLYCYHPFERKNRNGYSSKSAIAFQSIKAARKNRWSSAFMFLKNMIVLTHSRTDEQISRLSSFPILKFYLGTETKNTLWYSCPRNPEKTKKAKEYFESLGMHVIDLTVVQPWEHVSVIEPIKRGPAVPRKKGLVSLKAGLSTANQNFTTGLLKADGADRIINPGFVVKISPHQDSINTIPSLRMDRKVALSFVRLYGSRGGVVSNALQEKKYLDNGAKEAKVWIKERLLEEFKTNPLIQTHYENTLENQHIPVTPNYAERNIYTLCRKDPTLRAKYNLQSPTGDHERDVVTLYEYFPYYAHTSDDILKEIKQLIDAWQFNTDSQVLIDKMKKSKLFDILDTLRAEYKLFDSTVPNPIKVKIRKFIVNIIEG